jgi:hypothetical protein
MVFNSASSLTILLDKTIGPIGYQEPGAGGEQQQQQDSERVGLKRFRDSSQKPAAADLKAIRHSHFIGPSQFSDFVFTPLSDAIREWGNTGNSKARNNSPFNIIATIKKWNIPQASKGVKSSNIFAQKINTWFKGSDIHVAATLLSNERDRTIYASFFFEPNTCPKKLVVGETVRLIGTRLQIWKGDLQLTGKNIQFGHSCVSMSLKDAIEAWKYVRREQPLLFLRKHIPGAQRHFPSLTMIVIVKMWGNATNTLGAQSPIIALMLYYIVMRVFRSRHAHCS